jgi:RNA polymerase-binding protein DksA
MEKTFINKMKKQLLDDKKRFEEELSKIAQKKGKKFVAIYPEYGSRDEDNAAEITLHEFNLALDKNLEKLLNDTLKALIKIDNGTYGHCENCNEEIAQARLEAYPAASTCIACQAKKENRFTKFFAKLKPHKNVKQPKGKK